MPCGRGGTDHLVLPLYIFMCVMERQSDIEGKEEREEKKKGLAIQK